MMPRIALESFRGLRLPKKMFESLMAGYSAIFEGYYDEHPAVSIVPHGLAANTTNGSYRITVAGDATDVQINPYAVANLKDYSANGGKDINADLLADITKKISRDLGKLNPRQSANDKLSYTLLSPNVNYLASKIAALEMQRLQGKPAGNKPIPLDLNEMAKHSKQAPTGPKQASQETPESSAPKGEQRLNEVPQQQQQQQQGSAKPTSGDKYTWKIDTKRGLIISVAGKPTVIGWKHAGTQGDEDRITERYLAAIKSAVPGMPEEKMKDIAGTVGARLAAYIQRTSGKKSPAGKQAVAKSAEQQKQTADGGNAKPGAQGTPAEKTPDNSTKSSTPTHIAAYDKNGKKIGASKEGGWASTPAKIVAYPFDPKKYPLLAELFDDGAGPSFFAGDAKEYSNGTVELNYVHDAGKITPNQFLWAAVEEGGYSEWGANGKLCERYLDGFIQGNGFDIAEKLLAEAKKGKKKYSDTGDDAVMEPKTFHWNKGKNTVTFVDPEGAPHKFEVPNDGTVRIIETNNGDVFDSEIKFQVKVPADCPNMLDLLADGWMNGNGLLGDAGSDGWINVTVDDDYDGYLGMGNGTDADGLDNDKYDTLELLIDLFNNDRKKFDIAFLRCADEGYNDFSDSYGHVIDACMLLAGVTYLEQVLASESPIAKRARDSHHGATGSQGTIRKYREIVGDRKTIQEDYAKDQAGKTQSGQPSS